MTEDAAKVTLYEVNETQISVQSYLPQLWSAGRNVLCTPGIPAHGETLRWRHRREREQQQWRYIGSDLRKAADHFQIYTSKVTFHSQAI